MPIISGYLKDGAANPVAECTIILHALKTSNEVIEQIESCTTAKDGFYQINALAGQYEVILSITGYPPKKVGVICVYSDSTNGSLNDFLMVPDNSEVSPAFIAAITELRNQTLQAKKQAEKAKNDAIQTLNNTVKKMGESSQTVNGVFVASALQSQGSITSFRAGVELYAHQAYIDFHYANEGGDYTSRIIEHAKGSLKAIVPNGLYENNVRVYSPNNKPSASNIGALPISGGTLSGDIVIRKNGVSQVWLGDTTNQFGMYWSGTAGGFNSPTSSGGTITRLRYSPGNNNSNGTWNFENSSVTIKSTPVLKRGDYGLGHANLNLLNNIKDDIGSNQSTMFIASQPGAASDSLGDLKKYGFTGLLLPYRSTSSVQYVCRVLFTPDKYGAKNGIPSMYLQQMVGAEWKKPIEVITTANSTVDSNGFLKSASPILRLFANEDIEAVDGLEKSGCGLVNNEAKGITAKRIDIGHYEIHGSLGFAKSGWYIETPQDANGNKKLFVEYTADENHIITVKSYENCFDNGRFVAGNPMDIPDGRWIDIRLTMPSNEQKNLNTSV